MIASDLVYTRIVAEELTSERSVEIYDQLLAMYTREADNLTVHIEEIQSRDYASRPVSELARICRERWLTLPENPTVFDLVDAIEISDDMVIGRLSNDLAHVVDLIVTCEQLIEEEEARGHAC